MASKKHVKELVKSYILENYSKQIKKENEEDSELERLYPQVSEVRDNLNNIQDERLTQSLRDIVTVEQAGQLLVQMLEFLNKSTPAPRLTTDLAIQFIQGDENLNSDEVKPEIGLTDKEDTEEESIEEMSTSAGSGAYNTKYAFKRKKK